MRLTGLHLLLTYACTYECDHCFVWSSPEQSGILHTGQVEEILRQTQALGTVKWFYFEGGEPFLYHAPLRWGVRRAAELGFQVGIVTNAYWATHPTDALEWLRDFVGLVQDLALSCDAYHGNAEQEQRVEYASAAAARVGIPAGVIRIAAADSASAVCRVGQLPSGESALMFRGRAADRLADRAPRSSWAGFTRCPYENLREPDRVHVDPLGYVHVCQGITIGNVFRSQLREICQTYDPQAHPVAGPLLAGGPARLAEVYAVPHEPEYADACHLCYRTRQRLRARFPEQLAPDQMYGPSSKA